MGAATDPPGNRCEPGRPEMTAGVPGAQSRFRLADTDVIGLTSVGIDIGSSTSQLSFSRLELERRDARYVVARRDLVHESEILLTPYLDETTIDTRLLAEFIEAQYRLAGVTHDEVDSGAVILTGLALAKHNSRNIADIFAAEAGKFVAVSAGDAIEATLATRGVGIDRLSAGHDGGVVHIDIGGGTTKFAFCEQGVIRRVAAIDIGARLVVFDADGRLARCEPPAERMLRSHGVTPVLGELLPPEALDWLAGHMADQILSHGGVRDAPAAAPGLLRTPPLFDAAPTAISLVTFSGGVAEYIYQRESATFGDLGKPLAEAIRRRVDEAGLRSAGPATGIRATVLGASQYSLQLSGTTVYASSESLLPVRNVPVVKPALGLDADELDPDLLRAELSRALAAFREAPGAESVAIALTWEGSATYRRIDALATALLATAGEATVAGGPAPLMVVCDSDVAGLLGRHIHDISPTNVPVLCVDGIEVSEFDYLDVGAFLPGTGALPVVVKSLLFPGPDGAGTRTTGRDGQGRAETTERH